MAKRAAPKTAGKKVGLAEALPDAEARGTPVDRGIARDPDPDWPPKAGAGGGPPQKQSALDRSRQKQSDKAPAVKKVGGCVSVWLFGCLTAGLLVCLTPPHTKVAPKKTKAAAGKASSKPRAAPAPAISRAQKPKAKAAAPKAAAPKEADPWDLDDDMSMMGNAK